MTTRSTEQADAASRAALEAIEDPAVRAGALAFVDALRTAVSGKQDTVSWGEAS